MAKLNSSWRLFNGGISKCTLDHTAWKRYKEHADKQAKARVKAMEWEAYLERRRAAAKDKRPENVAKKASVMKIAHKKAVDLGVKIGSSSMWLFVGTSLTFMGRIWAIKETYNWFTKRIEEEAKERENEKQKLKEEVSRSKKKTVETVMKQQQDMMGEWLTWKKETEEHMMMIVLAAMRRTTTTSEAPPTNSAAGGAQ